MSDNSGTLAKIGIGLSCFAIGVSALQWYETYASRVNGAKVAEETELAAFRSSVARPLTSPAWDDLHRLLAENADLARKVLDASPRNQDGPGTDQFSEDATLLGDKIEAVLSPAASATCQDRLAAWGRLATLATAGIITPERLREVALRPLNEFMTEEALRCGLAMEDRPANRALAFASYYLGTASSGNLYVRDPLVALDENAWKRVQVLCAMLDVNCITHYEPPIPFDGSLGNVKFEGCGGWISSFAVTGDPTAVRGSISFNFAPQWDGTPGEDLGCVRWMSKDQRSGFFLGFTRDGTEISYKVPRLGRVAATVPFASVPFTRAMREMRHIVASWDFTGLDPRNFLTLSVDGTVARSLPPRRRAAFRPAKPAL